MTNAQHGFNAPPSTTPTPPTPQSKWPEILDPNRDGVVGPISTGLWIFLSVLVVAGLAASVTLAVTDTADLGKQTEVLLQIVDALLSIGLLGGGMLAWRRNKKRVGKE